MIAIACLAGLGCQAQQQTDEFTTKSGKKVRITCIKHASMQINYNGLEIEVDPVGKGMKPETDYSKFPKADIILVTHEHHDHFDRDAIAQLSKASTKIFLNPAVQKMLGSGKALKNGDEVKFAKDITIEAVPAYNTTPGGDGQPEGYRHRLPALQPALYDDHRPGCQCREDHQAQGALPLSLQRHTRQQDHPPAL